MRTICAFLPGREVDPQRYTRWLLEAFDLWFDFYPDLPVRMFDAVLASAAGVPSNTDALGLGDVSLITIRPTAPITILTF